MGIRQVAIDASSVTLGMYVSMLDRPWLETPFIFQGFEVTERSEIDMLQRYCSVVYIDVDRGDLSDVQVQRLLNAPPPKKRAPASATGRKKRELPGFLLWLLTLLSRLRLVRKPAAAAATIDEVYPIQATVRSEAGQARAAYDKLLCDTKNKFVIIRPGCDTAPGRF